MPCSIRSHVVYPHIPRKVDPPVYNQTDYGFKPWSKADETTLRALYGKLPVDELAIRLDRTTRSVNHRASCMGLAPARRGGR